MEKQRKKEEALAAADEEGADEEGDGLGDGDDSLSDDDDVLRARKKKKKKKKEKKKLSKKSKNKKPRDSDEEGGDDDASDNGSSAEEEKEEEEAVKHGDGEVSGDVSGVGGGAPIPGTGLTDGDAATAPDDATPASVGSSFAGLDTASEKSEESGKKPRPVSAVEMKKVSTDQAKKVKSEEKDGKEKAFGADDDDEEEEDKEWDVASSATNIRVRMCVGAPGCLNTIDDSVQRMLDVLHHNSDDDDGDDYDANNNEYGSSRMDEMEGALAALGFSLGCDAW